MSYRPESEIPQERWGEEWSLEYVRRRLRDLPAAPEPSQAPPPDGYEKAAAVLAYFDPNEIRPMPGETTGGKGQLLLNSAVVSDEQGRPMSILRPERRREALEALGFANMQSALGVNRGPDSPVQRMLAGYINGKAASLDSQTPPELSATLQVIEWLSGLVPTLPPTAEVQRRVERESLLRPCRELAGQGFGGRRKELQRLREYVGFLESQSLRENAARSLRDWFNWHEKPPLVIFGPGGMGKSALLSRFILDHLAPGPENAAALPFVYLDFDRASLIPERPVTLLVESERQLAAQFGDLRRERHDFQALNASVGKPSSNGALAREFRDFLASGGLMDQPLLLVLDTFEEVQYRSRDFVEEVFTFLDALQQQVPRLRVVVVGRARVTLDKYPTENVLLQPLEPKDAAEILEQRGLSGELASRVAEQVGGNPLSLRLALEVIQKQGAGRRGIEGLETRNRLYMRLQDSQIQGQLYRRILGFVHSPEVAKLAHPGLVLRRITPELILEVLAEPCEVKVPNLEAARHLFAEMQREVSLVTVAEDGSLRHLPEVRRVMIDLLRKDDPVKIQEIQERAIRYYRKQPGLAASAEALYHMLALGRPRRELESVWSSGMEVYLGGALEEIPPRSRAWLAPRIGFEVDEIAVGEGDLEDWERYAYQRVRNLLQLRKPDDAIAVLSGREERSYASPLSVVQAQAQWLTHDYEGARASIATGLRELQDPESLLKLHVLTSFVDALPGDGPKDKLAVAELQQIRKRFGDDPRVLRFGLNRLHLVEDAWSAREGESMLADIAEKLPDTRLSLYPLLGSDLAVRLGVQRVQELIRLARVGDLGDTSGTAASAFTAEVERWDKQTGVLSRYRIAAPAMQYMIPNLALILDREGLPPEVITALWECFRERSQARSDQVLYEEMEVENRPPLDIMQGAQT